MLRKYGAPALGFTVGIGLIAALLFSMRNGKPAPENAVNTAQQKRPTPPAPKELTMQCRIEAVHTVPVSVAIAGEIDSFSAEIGQDVVEGQVLARISNKGLESGRDNTQRVVKIAEEKLNSLETAISAARLEASRVHTESVRANEDVGRTTKEYERQRMLNNVGATPRLTFEKAQKEYDAARNESEGLIELARRADDRVEELTRELDNTKKTLADKRKELEEVDAAITAMEVHAPVAGMIVARQGEIGKTLTQQEAAALFRIASDISALEAVFPPDAALKQGDTVGITFTDIAGDPLPAVIREIKNGEAVAEFTSANPAIRPLMPCVAHARLK